MAMARMALTLMAAALALLALALPAQAGSYLGTNWIGGVAHATYYGGVDASGTLGGACGYGNLYSTGYGINTAALSSALFNSGLTCGACFELQCDATGSKYCLPGSPTITITATNYCPQGSLGGWCDAPRQHFDLAQPMFVSLAYEGGGVIPVNYRRVPCVKTGGMRFQINGNPWFLLVLVTNVGGAGDVQQLYIKGDNTGWYPMIRNWGQMWQLTGNSNMPGQALSFRAVLSDGTSVQSMDVAPANWRFQQLFEGSQA
jgi:hypothetical protein